MPRKRQHPPKYTWEEGQITLILPEQTEVEQMLTEEQHTILWALEQVSNKETFDAAMVNAAWYLAEHPTDKIVAEAIARAEQRIENAT